MPKIKISVAPSADGAKGPVPMQFLGSAPTPDSIDSIELVRNCQKQHQLEMRAETERVRFAGNNYTHTNSLAPQATGQLLIGIYDKAAKTLKLVPAPTTYVMSGTTKKEFPEPPRYAEEAEGEGGQQSYAQIMASKRQLVSEMGAAKARKKQDEALKKRVTAANVHDQAAFMEDVSAVLDDASAAAAATSRTPQEEHPLHPPFDLEAGTPIGCYPREGLIPPAVWDALPAGGVETTAEALGKMEKDKLGLWCPFLIERLRTLPSARSARTDALKPLLFLAYLLRFSTLSKPLRVDGAMGARTTRRTESKEHPDAIKLQIDADAWAYLLATFCEEMTPREGATPSPGAPGSRIMTATMREKLLLHALALALHIADCVLPVEAVAKPLSLTEAKVAFYLRQLGCNLAVKDKIKTANLSVPLTFPKISKGAPQGRK